MMASDQNHSEDHGGDYGYDLAHEPGVLRIPAQRTAAVPAMSGVPFQVDPDGDLGYDEAHHG